MEAETKTFPIRLTEAAVKQIKRIQARENKAGTYLRIGVKGGGCSGLEYVLRFETEKKQADSEKEFDGVRVLVDDKSAVYLNGTTVDYTGQLIGGGFAFENPNAQRSCGCGTSFTPKNS